MDYYIILYKYIYTAPHVIGMRDHDYYFSTEGISFLDSGKIYHSCLCSGMVWYHSTWSKKSILDNKDQVLSSPCPTQKDL